MAKKKNKKQPPKPSPAKLSPEEALAKQRLDLARKIARNSARSENSTPAKYRRYTDASDLDDARAKRRISATLSVMDAVKALAQPLCPDVPDFYSFEEDWLEQNLDSFNGYDRQETHTHTQLAASLWILDRLRDERRTFDACQLFPRDHRLFDELDFPEICDASHEIDPIMGMLWTIRHRNDDCTGLPHPKSKGQAAPLPRPYLDRYTAENLHHQDVPSRNRFTKILALIPQEEIDRAVKLYEDTFWDLVRRYFAGRETQVQESKVLAARREQYVAKAETLIAEMKQTSPMFLEAKQKKTPVLVASDPFQMRVAHTMEMANRKNDQLLRARELDSIQDQLEEAHFDLDERVDLYRHAFGEMLMAAPHLRADLHTPEIAAIWSDFQIQDPYALCFAFLYLLDTGSDLPWVFGISTQLMTLCASVLPWRYTDFQIEEDPYWLHYNDEVGDYVYPTPKQLPKRLKVPPLENWYAMDYTDKTIAESEYQESCNLAQILYEITGGIMPRDLTRYEGALETLDRYGISGKKALHPLMYCMTFLGETRHQTPMIQLPDDFFTDSEQAEPKKKSATAEELQQQLRELQEENRQLRAATYDAGREARELKKKLEQLESASNADRQELADLRELVFHQQEDVFTDAEPTADIEFPYTANQRIVVFGGHDSWAREIKPRLPNVRFIDRTMLPNAELIRRADVIWIQTNALSHAYFYKIIDEARKHHIPVRYFSYASAGKCAEQLAMADMGDDS